MGWHLANFILSVLSFIAFVLYALWTRKIANKDYAPLISMTIKRGKKNKLHLFLENHSKVEIEVFGKIKTWPPEEFFESNIGFYGDKHSLILAPLWKYNGGFDLNDLVDKQGKKLKEFIESGDVEGIRFYLHLKYRKFKKNRIFKKRNWKKYHDFKWSYNFKTQVFFLDDSP